MIDKYILKKFQVKRYRSLMDATIDIFLDEKIVICGENNIGKTNFLRAMNVFFNHYKQELYNLKEDIGQKHNLADKYPKKVKELTDEFEALKLSTGKKTRF